MIDSFFLFFEKEFSEAWGMSHGVSLLARWEGKRSEGAVSGERDELWAVDFDVTRRPADLE